jgi:hypothetical protein
MYNDKPKSGYKIEGSVPLELADTILNAVENLDIGIRHSTRYPAFATTQWLLFPAFYRYDKYADILNSPQLKAFKDFVDICSPAIEYVESLHPDFMVFYTEINRIQPMYNVARHIDNRWYLEQSKRMHVVLETNDDCSFMVDDKKATFSKGQVFEFNNYLYHSVHNQSPDKYRTHMVIDLIPKYDVERFDDEYYKSSMAHMKAWKNGRPKLPDYIDKNML